MSRLQNLSPPAALAALALAMVALLGGCDSSPTEPCPMPIDITGDIVPPVRISGDQPQYTDEARRARVQGVVILQAVINCRGDVQDITVLKGLPMGLTEAAVAAVRTWRFRPATLNGRPISVYYNTTVNFRLQ